MLYYTNYISRIITQCNKLPFLVGNTADCLSALKGTLQGAMAVHCWSNWELAPAKHQNSRSFAFVDRIKVWVKAWLSSIAWFNRAILIQHYVCACPFAMGNFCECFGKILPSVEDNSLAVVWNSLNKTLDDRAYRDYNLYALFCCEFNQRRRQHGFEPILPPIDL